MKFFYSIGLVILSLSLVSCSSKDVDIGKYDKKVTRIYKIPKACKKLYKNSKIKVAVVHFTNNSTFGRANTRTSNSDYKAGIEVVGIYSKTDRHSRTAVVEPKLANAFVPKIEQMLLNTGGVELYTRADMGKVNAELKLQDSGLLDSDSVVEFGKLSGVRYIVTGSIDYVKHKFQNYSQYSGSVLNASAYSGDRDVVAAAAVIHLVSSLFDGTDIDVGTTVKIIDVKTGKIMFSKQVKESVAIKSNQRPTYSELVGAVKYSIDKALPSLANKFQKYFSLNGYITNIKTNGQNYLAKINLGEKDGIKKADKFTILSLESHKDPISGKTQCTTSRTSSQLTATKYINDSSSWLKTDKINNLKIYKLIKKEFK